MSEHASVHHQIGGGTGDDITDLIHTEAIYADGLGEAINKAKAVTFPAPSRYTLTRTPCVFWTR